MQRRGQRRTPVPPFRRSDQAKRRIGRETGRVVEVFVARQAAVDRLPQEIRQRELRVQSVAGVAQVLGDDRLQPEAFIQLAIGRTGGTETGSPPVSKTVRSAEQWVCSEQTAYRSRRPFVSAARNRCRENGMPVPRRALEGVGHGGRDVAAQRAARLGLRQPSARSAGRVRHLRLVLHPDESAALASEKHAGWTTPRQRSARSGRTQGNVRLSRRQAAGDSVR